MTPIHASAVAIGRQVVLIEGPSGSGKSDLALRLIDRGAVLVSDDRTVLTRSGDTLLASAPATIAGLIEVRGVGIVRMDIAGPLPVRLLVRLQQEIERLPALETVRLAGVAVALLRLDPRPASAPVKVERKLAMLDDEEER